MSIHMSTTHYAHVYTHVYYTLRTCLYICLLHTTHTSIHMSTTHYAHIYPHVHTCLYPCLLHTTHMSTAHFYCSYPYTRLHTAMHMSRHTWWHIGLAGAAKAVRCDRRRRKRTHACVWTCVQACVIGMCYRHMCMDMYVDMRIKACIYIFDGHS